MDFFQTAGKNLTAAEVAAGVRHHVALSVVGTERLQDSGYFRAKLAQETLIKSSPIPYTLVRATQFFEFIRGIAQSARRRYRAPAALAVPADGGGRCRDRGRRSGACRAGERHGRDRRPRNFHIDELVGKVLAMTRIRARSSAIRRRRYFGVKVNDQSLVPGPNPRLGATKFDWWLTHVPPPPNPRPDRSRSRARLHSC